MSGFDTPAHHEYLARIDETVAAGPHDARWERLGTTPPRWYVDGKFGIFIHWGVYSVPAFSNEWYPRQMYREGSDVFEHHRATWGDQREFGYKDFVPMFKAEGFDPGAWAELFRRSGAQFVVPVAEHHDGFAMYDTAFSRWKASEMGPHRDVVGELGEAVRAQGMAFGVSSHRAEHWFFFNGGVRFPSDVTDPASVDLYGPASREEMQPSRAFLDDWLVRCCEIVDKYRPELVWFDWWIEQPAFEPYLRRFAAYYYNRASEWGREVAINYKFDAFAPGTAVFDVERGQLATTRQEFWQTDTSVATTSWSHVEPQQYKDVADIIRDLVDIVSKNGALLLNIGPKADGTIPDEEVRMLETIGRWLAANGEAIYGTRPWLIPGEGPTAVPEGSFSDTDRAPFTARDIRFTTALDAVYATVLGPVAGSEVRIRSFGSAAGLVPGEIDQVRILGNENADVAWRREEDALVVSVPAGRAADLPIVFRIRSRAQVRAPRVLHLVADHAW